MIYRDLVVVGNQYIVDPVPAGKNYLCPYFKTEIRRAFIKYYIATDGDIWHFSEHTGYYCSMRYVKKMQKQLRHVEKAWQEAKDNFDIEVTANIKNGKYSLTDKGFFLKKNNENL